MASSAAPPSRARRLALGLATTVALLVVGELGLRVALGPPPPPVPVYTAVAEQSRYLSIEGGLVTLLYQFQQPIPPFPAKSATPRVAFLGGSSVHNNHADYEFPALVSRATGIETLNLANPALDSHDTVRIVEELAAVDVAALVVYDGHNDFGNIYFASRYTGAASLAARAQALLGRFRLFATLRDALSAPAGVAKRRSGVADGSVTAAQREAALAGFEANLRRVAWLGRSRGIPVVVGTPVSCATLEPHGKTCAEAPCAADVWREAKALAERGAPPEEVAARYTAAVDVDPIPLRAPSAALEVVRKVAADEDLTLVDVEAAFPRDPKTGLPDCAYLTDNVHFNGPGHSVVAEIFAPTIRKLIGTSGVSARPTGAPTPGRAPGPPNPNAPNAGPPNPNAPNAGPPNPNAPNAGPPNPSNPPSAPPPNGPGVGAPNPPGTPPASAPR